MPYLGKTPSQATRQRYYKTASGGETSISGTMTTGGTLTFNDGEFVDVSVNGVALVAGTDYNTTTANTIAGLSALAANDQVEIVVYDTFSVFGGNVDADFTINNGTLTVGTTTIDNNGDVKLADSDVLYLGSGLDLQIQHNGSGSFITDAGTGDLHIRTDTNLNIQNAAGSESKAVFATDGAVELYHDNTKRIETTSSGVDITGGFTATDSCTITVDDNADTLVLKCTDADAVVGPILVLQRDSGSPADNDALGFINFTGDDDGGTQTAFATIAVNALDVTSGTLDGEFKLSTIVDNNLRSRMQMTASETVFNEDSIDLDFRVEGNGNANALVVHGADDFVGIGLGTPKKRLHIQDSSSDGMIILDRADTSADHQICFAHNYGNSNQSGGNYYAIGVDDSENTLVFAFDANSQASLSADAKLILDSDGTFTVRTTPAAGVNGVSLRASDGNGGRVNISSSSTGGYHAMKFFNANGEVGSIGTSGTSTSFNTSSDYRLKENVVNMTGAIDRVKALTPKRFNFTADSDTTVDGFLAHEAQTIVPEAVTGTKDETREVINAVLSADGHLIAEDITEAKWTAGKQATQEYGKTIPAIYPSDSTWSAKHTEPVMQGIDQAKLVPLLTGALQEAIAEIETLKTKVAALEAGE